MVFPPVKGMLPWFIGGGSQRCFPQFKQTGPFFKAQVIIRVTPGRLGQQEGG